MPEIVSKHSIYGYDLYVCMVCMTNGLYYKPMMIANDDSRVVNKIEALLTDDARVVIYDHHMFIVQATSGCLP
jgi:hypothetical protein